MSTPWLDLAQPGVRERIGHAVRAFRGWNRCFGIGANKTGTTSLHAVAVLLGLRADQALVEGTASLQAMRGNYRPLQEAMAQLDFHQDLPCSQGHTYVALDALFPGSRFILTIREPQAWLRSFVTHYSRDLAPSGSPGGRSEPWLFPGYVELWLRHYASQEPELASLAAVSGPLRPQHLADPAVQAGLLRAYERRNATIQAYFRLRPADLLVLDLAQEPDVAAIVRFLGLPPWINFPMPHLNAAGGGQRPVSGLPPLQLEP
jgi:hypothetical protein